MNIYIYIYIRACMYVNTAGSTRGWATRQRSPSSRTRSVRPSAAPTRACASMPPARSSRLVISFRFNRQDCRCQPMPSPSKDRGCRTHSN